ncbi:MAG: peptidoglycan editing factor PgeF [Alphaproteobacteria bacterium]|nr:peptidoglycan editing factor PgeF [Alphaproteobacteria bacterium]
MTLEILTADELLPFRHGFFTRKGGVSSGIYEGLNCGPGSSDQSDAVLANRRLVAEAMGLPKSHLASLHQVHSPDVLVVDGPLTTPRPKCDAMVSATLGVALGILTADCQPVLFAEARSGVVAAAHAGWKGALNGVLGATVDAMVGLGAERRKIKAVIGPCISQRAYEVGPEFMDVFLELDPEFSRFFAQGTGGGKGDRVMFDLPAFGLFRLREAGIAEASYTGHCTYSDPERFYSYRRTTHAGEADYGRLISVIAP